MAIKKRISQPAARFILSMVMVTAVCGFMISIQGFMDRVFPADVAVVLGNEVFADSSLSPRLKGRVDAAWGLYRHGMVKKIIVSGGMTKVGVIEAEAMRKYLLENGIPDEDIIMDREAKNTRGTAQFTAKYMHDNNLQTVIAVSQFYHLPRAAMALKQEGIEHIGTLHSTYFEARDIYSVIREIPACFAYWSSIK